MVLNPCVLFSARAIVRYNNHDAGLWPRIALSATNCSMPYFHSANWTRACVKALLLCLQLLRGLLWSFHSADCRLSLHLYRYFPHITEYKKEIVWNEQTLAISCLVTYKVLAIREALNICSSQNHDPKMPLMQQGNFVLKILMKQEYMGISHLKFIWSYTP